MSIRLSYETNQKEQPNQNSSGQSIKKVFPFPKLKQLAHDENAPTKVSNKASPGLKIDKVKKFSQKVLSIEGVEVLFPTTPHTAQLKYMETVIKALKQKENALLQTPIANGKAALLCSILAWLKAEREGSHDKLSSNNMEKIKIIFISKSHSHLKQVVNELKNTCYKPIVSVIGSRELLCIKPELQGLKGNELETKCNQTRNNHYKGHRCSYYDKLQTYQDKILQTFQENILDIEEVHSFGEKNGFCPFFYSQQLQQVADIVFIPYHKLLKKEMHSSMKKDLKNAVVVFDEGHGVQAALEDGASFELTSRLLLDCEIDISLLQDKLKLFPDESNTTLTDLSHLSEVIRNLSKNFGKWRAKLLETSEYKEKGKFWPGREVFKIFKDLVINRGNNSTVSTQSQPRAKNPFAEGIDSSNIDLFRDILLAACKDLSDNIMNKNGLTCLRNIIDLVIPLMEDASNHEKGGEPEKSETQLVDCYDLYARVDPENSESKPLNGFHYFQSLGPRSIIINSATLMPMRSFEKNLKARFDTHLINSQIFDVESQCFTVILKKGMNNIPFNFSDNKKDNEAVIKDLGSSLVNLARVVPNGMLVLFASNDLMSQCFELWAASTAKESPVLERLESMKKIFKEDKYIQLTKHMVEDYMRHAKGRGAIFFATCEGRAFEELEFTDDMSRAVLIVGTPFPPIETKREELKKIYLESNPLAKTSAKDWCLQQTMRTVNQAFSKAIKHQNDFGVVILCDERYDLSSWNDLIVDYAKQNLISVDNFAVGHQKIAQFFKDRAIKPPALKTLIQKPQEPSPLKNTNEVKLSAKRPQDDLETQILGRLLKKSTIEKETDESALRQWDELFKNNEALPRKIVTASDLDEFSIFKSMPRRSNSPIMLESLSTRDTIPSSVKENLADNSVDSVFEELKQPNVEKGKINSSLFHLINKKKESLNRREPLEPQKVKQIKEPEQKNDNKDTFLKNFELNYDPQVPAEDIKDTEDSLPKPSKRFILNRRLIGDMMVNKKSSPVPSGTDDMMEILEESKELHSNTNVKMSTLPPKLDKNYAPKPSLRLAPTQKDTQISNNTSQNIQGSQRDATTTNYLQQPYSVQNTSRLSCMICYATGSDGRVMSSSKCGHIACQNCWEKWLKTKLECPMCKNKVRPKTLIQLGSGIQG